MAQSDFVNLVNDEGDGFDQNQMEQAIRMSLANTGLPLPKPAQPKPRLHEDDDDLQRALAESMRTFEAEQHGGGMAGRKRSSSDEGPDAHQQQEQGDYMLDVQQQQQPATTGGSLKRQRSVSTPGNGSAGLEQHPHLQQQNSVQQHGRLAPPHAGVVVTTALHPQQPQPHHHALGVLPLQGVQRSASTTNAAAGLRQWLPMQQQQQRWGLGRSASVHDLQALAGGQQEKGAGSEDRAGSRPASPVGQHQHRGGNELLDLLNEPDAEDEEDYDADEFMDAPNSDSSMSSIAHESGLPHTISTWGQHHLQGGPAAAAQPAPRLIGPGPVPGDPADWCIHGRQYFAGQLVFWQPCRQGVSYAGRILTAEGGGGGGAPMLYTAEVHGHPQGLSYVEATAAQLHPQLRLGEFVWCKPAAVKRSQWSHKGPLYHTLHPPGSVLACPQAPEEGPWRLGVVVQLQVWDGRNPIAELRIIGTGGNDCCWFKAAQLELAREVGESSAAAERRAQAAAAAAAGEQAADAGLAAAAVAGGGDGELDVGLDDLYADEVQSTQPGEQQEQGDEGLLQLAAAGEQHDLAAAAPQPQQQVAAAELQDDQLTEPLPEADGTAEQTVRGPSAASPAAGVSGGASPEPAAAAAPSLLSHPAAALTGESELEAGATAGAVEQAAGVPTSIQQAHGPAPVAMAAAEPQAVTVAAGKAHSPQQQQRRPPVLEGTGESAEGLVEEVVEDSCGALCGEAATGGGEAQDAVPSPQQPLSNQHSGIEDQDRAGQGQEGYGET